jgi:hypothetical protein
LNDYFSDLKLEWNEEDHENINVPMQIYERACVTDPKEGVEVRSLFFVSVEKRLNLDFVRLLLELVFQL